MKKDFWPLWLFAILIHSSYLPAQEYKSGDAEIDRIRAEVKLHKTTEENRLERTKMLYMWLGALQQQGARTLPFFDLDLRFRTLETKINRLCGIDLNYFDPKPTKDYKDNREYQEAMIQICRTLDESYELMDQIQKELIENGPMFTPFEAEQEVTGGDLSAEWPLFQADKHNTGATTAPGPSYGREKWKFPVGLGWYPRPLIEGDRVYVTSPGMRVNGYCLDLKSGKEIWSSSRDYPRFYLYDYPVMASSPLLINDQIVLREIRGRGIVFLDKETGETEYRRNSGFVDYRTRYTAISGNEDRLVYPFGEHNIEGIPPVHQNFNRLVCIDAQDDLVHWDYNAGDIDALAEPVISGDKVFQGTMEGYLYALNLTGESGPWNKNRLAWMFKANGSVNSAVIVEEGKVFFGANGGSVYCLSEKDGKLIWEFNVQKPEKRARKHFTTPVLFNGHLYVGGADKFLYCINAADGKFLWKIEADDWIRARPVVDDDNIYFATIGGRLYNADHHGEVRWDKKISGHPIYADLVGNSDGLLLTSSDLMLHCIGKKGKKLWEKSILCSFINGQGERIYSDQVSGGTWFQSKPTAAEGRLYFGTPSGFLYCVNAESGEEDWKFEMGGAISVGAAIADGKVYAGQQGGERFFYCLDAKTGELVWKQTLPGGWVWGSATVDEGLVYIPTCSGYAVCLDGETGKMVWMYPTARGIPAEPAIDGDLVYFGSWSRSLYAFNKKTGEIIWKAHGIVLDSGTLIAKNGKIYLPDHRTIYNYLDGMTGELLHGGNTNEEEKGKYSNFNGSPAYADGRAFFSARVGRGYGGIPMSSRVYCVDPLTARIYWTFPDGGGVSAPALASGRVYIASGNTPFFYCLDQKTGKPHWIFKLGNRVEESTLCIYRKMVYALSYDGYIHAIE